MTMLKPKSHCILFLFLFNFTFIQAQQLSGPRWILMSIDNLETGVVKVIGEHVRAELWFEGDSVYKGQFCNPYQGKIKVNQDFTCQLSTPITGKRKCMGFSDVETDLFKLYNLVNKYKMKGQLLYLFTSDKKRLVFKSEP